MVQSLCTRMIKTWLGLSTGTTTAILHHPNVIDIPTLSKLRTQAKLTLLSSVSTSNDPVIKEIYSLIIMLDQEFSKDLNIIPETNHLLVLAESSTITSKSLSQSCQKVCRKWRVGLWNNKRDNLTVQNKFTNITELEAQNQVWNWIRDGLPVGQLSFLLQSPTTPRSPSQRLRSGRNPSKTTNWC